MHGIDSADITEEDVHNLMAMCPFESIGLEKPSPFCKLFTEEEWGMFEYLGDVEKYHKTGSVYVLSSPPLTLPHLP